MNTPQHIRDNKALEDITIAVAAEVANVIDVTVTAKQPVRGGAANPVLLSGYVSDNNDGSTISAGPTTLAIQGDGTLTEHVSNRIFTLTLPASGSAVIRFGQAGNTDFYLVLIKPEGGLVISALVNFS